MNWQRPLIRGVIIFGLIYYTLTFIFTLPATRSFIKNWLTPKVESFYKNQFPEAFIKITPPPPDQNVDELWVSYENLEKLKQEREKVERNPNLKSTFTPLNLILYIHSLFVFPFILFFSLMLSTPIPWRPKLIGTGIGSLLLLLYLRLNLNVKFSFLLQRKPIGIHELSPTWSDFILEFAPRLTPGVSISLVLLIWIVTVVLALPQSFLQTEKPPTTSERNPKPTKRKKRKS